MPRPPSAGPVGFLAYAAACSTGLLGKAPFLAPPEFYIIYEDESKAGQGADKAAKAVKARRSPSPGGRKQGA